MLCIIICEDHYRADNYLMYDLRCRIWVKAMISAACLGRVLRNFLRFARRQKLLGAMEMQDFSAKDEVVEITFQLAEFPNAEHFIFKALDKGIALCVSDIEELILFDNKKFKPTYRF